MTKNLNKTKKAKESLVTRPPIVVVLGHVDSGKTSILDAIRKTHVVEKESGEITQHIGAYQVAVPAGRQEYKEKSITFIDTPGHEAFSAMRSRGAKVADIAVLVVDACEGVKPQTKEAISYIKKADIPMIVALNKIDKVEAQPEKIKGVLGKEEVIVESMGGKVPCIEVSAKSGQGIDELLEMIVLVGEMEELKSDDKRLTEGVVIESYLDVKRGPTATLLIRDGSLTVGDIVGTASAFGKIKTLENFQSKNIDKAPPSTPVIVTGLNEVPEVGEKFYRRESLEEAVSYFKKKEKKKIGEGKVLEIESGKRVLNLIIKADVRGSLQAIQEILKVIPQDEVILRILKTEVGEINESDIKLAIASRGSVIGFRTKVNSNAFSLSDKSGVKVLTHEVVYELTQGVRNLMQSLIKPEIIRKDLGRVEIQAIFRTEKNRQIVGGKVISGEVKKGVKIEVLRQEERIGKGKLVQLQQNKKEIGKVLQGQECGILFEGDTRIQEGDVLEIYEEEKTKHII